jgi:hypothetical protein
MFLSLTGAKSKKSKVKGKHSSDYLLHSAALRLCGLILLLSFGVFAQNIPSPKSVLGFHPTDDRTIADWTQISDYFAKLDAASDKVKVEEIGKTTLGKTQIVAYISSAGNIKNLEKYKLINQQIADPRQNPK